MPSAGKRMVDGQVVVMSRAEIDAHNAEEAAYVPPPPRHKPLSAEDIGGLLVAKGLVTALEVNAARKDRRRPVK